MIVESKGGRITSAVILLLGAVVYGFLCQKAMWHRGFPPIDPIWIGFGYTWLVPIAISIPFDSIENKFRQALVLIYGCVTGFFFSGLAFDLSTPRMITLNGMLVASIFFGPFHAFVGWLFQLVIESLISRFECVKRSRDLRKYSISMLLYLMTWISIGFGVPLVYRSLHFAQYEKERDFIKLKFREMEELVEEFKKDASGNHKNNGGKTIEITSPVE